MTTGMFLLAIATVIGMFITAALAETQEAANARVGVGVITGFFALGWGQVAWHSFKTRDEDGEDPNQQ